MFHKKQPFDFYYIFAKLWTIFIKITVCSVENVLSSTVKTFANALYILCKALFNIESKQNREHSTVFT